MASPPPADPSPARQTRVVVATATASSMAFIDMTAVNTALPAMQRGLGASTADAQWIMEAYLLFVAALMLVGGALGDRFGRRRVFRWGVLSFAATSLLCGLATTPGLLIAARAGQGVASALLVPSSLALLNASFAPDDRARAIGAWAAVTSMVMPLGPLLGGGLTDLLGWQWIFFINLPVAALVMWMMRGVVRPPYDPPPGGRFDLPGAATATIGLGGLTFAMIELPRLGADSLWVWTSAIGGAVGLLAFLWVERRMAEPMLPPVLWRYPTFSGINLQTLLLFGGLQAVTFFLPFLLIQTRGFSALMAGAALLPISLGISVLSRLSGRLVALVGRRRLIVTGPLVAAAGVSVIALAADGGGFVAGILPGVTIMGIGLGLAIAPLTAIAINAAGEGRSGLASAVNNAVARTGALLAIALLGLVAVPLFQAELTVALAPDAPASLALTGAARAAITAQSIRMAAIDLPPGLDPDVAAQVRDRIAAAHAHAFQAAMVLAALLMALGSAAAWCLVGRADQRHGDAATRRPD